MSPKQLRGRDDRAPHAARCSRNTTRFATRWALVLLAATAHTGPVWSRADVFPDARATSGAIYAVPREVIAGGGDTSSGGAYSLVGSIGQVDADPLAPSSGGGFAVSGGFWPGIRSVSPAADVVFVDGFEAPVP